MRSGLAQTSLPASPGVHCVFRLACPNPEARLDTPRTRIPEIVAKYETELLSEWIELQVRTVTHRRDLIRDEALREQSQRFLEQFRIGMGKGGVDPNDATWDGARDVLAEISHERARLGFSPSE